MPPASSRDHEAPTSRGLGVFGALWGLGGVLLLIGGAVFRLSRVALQTFSYPLHGIHWVALVTFTLLMAYAEGYRGFQKGLAPRVSQRARYLKHHPRYVHAFFAPFFCMGYIDAPGRKRAASILLTLLMLGMIPLVRTLNQPWRGIIDLGVVTGLIWGAVSLLILGFFAFTSGVPGDPVESHPGPRPDTDPLPKDQTEFPEARKGRGR